jgi:hypothetical protein
VSIVGRTYLERGDPVVVLIQWGRGGGPRNVLIERQNGTKVVRPFRGLRKPRSPAASLTLDGDPVAPYVHGMPILGRKSDDERSA